MELFFGRSCVSNSMCLSLYMEKTYFVLFVCRMFGEVGVGKILVGRDNSLFVTLVNSISLELQRRLCCYGQLCSSSIAPLS